MTMLDPHIRADEDQQSFYTITTKRRRCRTQSDYRRCLGKPSASKFITIITCYKGCQSSYFFILIHLDFISQLLSPTNFPPFTTDMATMNALAVETVGKPIVLIQRPIPTPTEGEILIKVTVVGCAHSSISKN